jgi:hypothetical protein
MVDAAARLIGQTCTVSEARARRELGCQRRVSRETGLRELANQPAIAAAV